MTGVMFDRAELLTLMPEDGTYIFNGRGFETIEIANRVGYEIGYDEIASDYVERPQAFIQEGQRVGRWTDGERVVFDRVFNVNGVDQEMAIMIAEQFSQKAIWSWEDSDVIEVRS